MPGKEQEYAERFANRNKSEEKVCECSSSMPFADSDACANCGGDVTFNPSRVYEGKLNVPQERIEAVNELTQDLADWERDSSEFPGRFGGHSGQSSSCQIGPNVSSHDAEC